MIPVKATVWAELTAREGEMARKDLIFSYRSMGLVLAVLALIASVLAAPLLQSFTAPVRTTDSERPEVIRGRPIAPSLLSPQRHG
jgi:hypothetical protein